MSPQSNIWLLGNFSEMTSISLPVQLFSQGWNLVNCSVPNALYLHPYPLMHLSSWNYNLSMLYHKNNLYIASQISIGSLSTIYSGSLFPIPLWCPFITIWVLFRRFSLYITKNPKPVLILPPAFSIQNVLPCTFLFLIWKTVSFEFYSMNYLIHYFGGYSGILSHKIIIDSLILQTIFL